MSDRNDRLHAVRQSNAGLLYWGIVVLSLAACGGPGPEAPGIGGDLDLTSNEHTTRSVNPCDTGATRRCDITIGEQNGILTCVEGIETCESGAWSSCRGNLTWKAYSPGSWAFGRQSPGLGSAALGDSSPCENNPCDPSCQTYAEDPDNPVKPVGQPVGGSFSSGSVSSLPGGFQSKALKDPNHPPTSSPCDGPEDCQLDHYCNTTTGLCVPYTPGQTNPTCLGYDFTAGPTCTNKIPVCNRGQTDAPAGVKVIVYGGNSSQMQDNLGVCSAAQIKGSVAGECEVGVPIPAGHCVDATCPAGVLGGTQSIVINPPAPPGSKAPLAECTCANNWTVYSNGGACQQVSCSAKTESSSLAPVRMFIMFDNSSSMPANGLWAPAKTAMKGFVQNPAAAGLGVALRFFGSVGSNACDKATCSIAGCSVPEVPLGVLTAATGAADPQETLLVNAIDNKTNINGTPIYAAVGGATLWASNYVTAHPTEKAVVVFVTDGEPNGCNENWNSISALASDAKTAKGVLTYVIGLYGSSQNNLNKLAAAGGTTQAFFINTTNATQLQAQLQAALNTIMGTAASCNITLPSNPAGDPNNVTVLYKTGGNPQTSSQVANLNACTSGNQWYLDSNTTPTNVTLCPSFCSTVQADSTAQIDVTLGCALLYEQQVYKQTYTSVCAPSERVQWGYFAYDTLTPSDSNIVFQAHTADTIAGLTTPLQSLATAQATPNTQTCAISGPSPCPVNLYAALGGVPQGIGPVLELVVTLNPSSNKKAAPSLLNWEITYSCVASE